MKSLEKVYSDKRKALDFTTERPVFAQLIPQISEKLRPLVLLRAVGLGSTATVWEVKDQKLNQSRALKLPRPRYGKLDKIIRVFTAESDKLASLTHHNIIKIYLSDQIETIIEDQRYVLPYFLMEFLDGIEDFDKYILSNLDSLNGDAIVTYLRDVALGLSFLHASEIVHCDIKPGNVFIAHKSPALVADLGYAKHFARPGKGEDDETTVYYTPEYAHPRLKEKMVHSSDSGGNAAVIEWKDLSKVFDLFSFGRTIQTVLGKIREKEQQENRDSVFTPYQWRYLTLIAVRLLDGQRVEHTDGALKADVIPGLSLKRMQELKYEFADEALEDFEKLLNFYDLEGEIPELNPNLSKYIQIPCGRVPITTRVKAVIDHPSFVRLTQVSQLGFVSLVYPGATHTRAEHSLGAFEKCCELVRALWYDENSCLFRSIMSKSNVEALLLASLLHDIGHYPMAHDLAEAYGRFAHDRYTQTLLERWDCYSGRSLADVIRAEWDTDLPTVLNILEADEKSPFRERILKSIVSGPLDVDKLDYLERDSLHTGVTFARNIDRGRLLRNLTICFRIKNKDEEDEELEVAEIGVTEKALAVAESIGRARKEMFRQIYWHHTVRVLKAMLTFVVRRIVIDLTSDDRLDAFIRSLNSFCLYPLGLGRIEDRISEDAGPSCAPPSELSAEASLGVDKSACVSYSHLTPSDDSVISFLWPHADPHGKAVLEMIRARLLYKRIAVLSHRRDSQKYDAVYEAFREERIRDHPEQHEERRRKLEEKIVAACGTDFSEAEFHNKHGDVPIILFDVPLKALRTRPSREALYYVPEEKLGLRPVNLFWKGQIDSLQPETDSKAFDKEVGKIRVLSHPACNSAIMSKMRSEQVIDELLKS
ncbi:MAG: protein kinase domain-containing protein [Thermodesulfobacteriota bacterium]